MNDALRVLKSLSDETRLKIVASLFDGEMCVCDIVPRVGRAQSTVSIHLGNLEDWDILESRREGAKVFYGLKDERVRDIFRVLGYPNARIFEEKVEE